VPSGEISLVDEADDDVETILAARRRERQGKSGGFCPNCGRSIQKSDRFCPKCGQILA
jgi:predicted amidophosphoribosyltransferase